MAFPNDQRPPRPRTVNHVNRDVARIIEHTLSQFDHWRDRTSMLQTAAERNGADRKAILTECKAMRSQIVEARTELLIGLAETPAKMSGHGRVVDVERALDSLDAILTQIERRCAESQSKSR